MNTAKPQKSICGEREQAMRLTIEKYHGLGNDYLVYDPNKNKLALTLRGFSFYVTEISAWERTAFWRGL